MSRIERRFAALKAEGRAALVAAEHKIKLPLRIMQRVQHSEVTFPWHAKPFARTQCHKAFDQQLSTVPHARILSLLRTIDGSFSWRQKPRKTNNRQVFLADYP